MSEQEIIERGKRAEQLLEDGVLGAAIYEAQQRAVKAWIQSDTPEAAVAARERFNAIEEIAAVLRGFRAEGTMSEHKLRNPR